MEDVCLKKNGILFSISPLIELISVIQIMAGDADGEFKSYYYLDNNEYITKIKERFSKYKNSSAIKNYYEYNVRNSQIMEYQFKNNILVCRNADASEKIKDYLKLLNEFLAESDFTSFYNENKDYYKNVINFNIKDLSYDKLTDVLKNYYNKDVKINMILKIVQSDWAEYLGCIDNYYTVLGGVSKILEYPQIVNEKGLISLAIHECTHPFVNQFLTSDYDFLGETEDIFLNLDENNEAKKYYSYYNTYMEDMVVRSITAYLQYKYVYEDWDAYQQELIYMENFGFIYMKDICKILEENDFYSSMISIKEYFRNIINSHKKNSNTWLESAPAKNTKN